MLHTPPPITVISSTVVGNSATTGGGIGVFNDDTITIRDTLLASNMGGNCGTAGKTVSQGYNVSDDNTCASAFTQTGDANSVAPGAGLDPSGLQDNGVPNPTIALLPTSPAVDHIPPANCAVSTDQRGVVRPQGPACDTGAFELVANGPVADASGAFQVNYASNLQIGDGVINVTNNGASAGGNTPLVNGNSYGDLCVNAYVYVPDQELATCCTCLVSLNSLHSWPVSFGPGNLLQNVNNGMVLASINQTHSVVIKLLAIPAQGDLTSAGGAVCPGPDAPGTGVTTLGGITGLGTGLVAWGTHAYPTNTTQANITETPFVPATLSAGELGKLTGDCRALLTTGSGRVCPGCRTGGLVTPDALQPKLP